MRIFKAGQKYSLKLGDLVFVVTPLTFSQKTEILDEIGRAQVTGDKKQIVRASMETIRYALKDIKGFVNDDGTPWVPEFEEEKLSMDSLEVVLNVAATQPMLDTISSFINGVPSSLPDGVSWAEQKK